jgi:hypothetical protein
MAAGSIPLVAGCAACSMQLSGSATMEPAVPTPTRPFGSIAEQWQPGDSTDFLARQWQLDDVTDLLGPQWQPGVTTGVLAAQWAPTTPQDVASSTTVAIDGTISSATGASTTSQDPAVQAAVAAEVGVTEAAFDEALRSPDDPTLLAAVEDATVEGSPARAEFVAGYNAIVDADQWAVPDPDVPNSVTVEVEPFITESGTDAYVVVCHVSGDSLMGREDSGGDVVLADSRNARLVLQTFKLVDNTWKLFERVQLNIIPEGTSCDAAASPSTSSSQGSSVP